MVGLIWFTARPTWICASRFPSRLILAASTEGATGPVAEIGSLQLSADWCLRWRRYAHFYKTIELSFFKTVWPCIVRDSLWIKPTDALSSSFIGITALHVSGSLSAHHQEFLSRTGVLVQFMQFGDRVLSGAGWNCSSILRLVALGPQTA
jgi:hypothetical protein